MTDRHLAQLLPIKFRHLFYGTLYPKEFKRAVVETVNAGKSLENPARRGPGTRAIKRANIHPQLLLSS